jgi:DNA-binding Lrp family transcriptional regulator
MRKGLRGTLQSRTHHEIEGLNLMTVTAYILLNVDMSTQTNVYETVKGLEETREVYQIFGAFDIIIKAEFQDNDQLSNFVVDKIKSLVGVLETQTNVCAATV